ncbi:MAG: ACT domain-containing protein [Clostridia bacterium]|nr:ACT domain-containing protein [Clostridia bacterium]MBQ7289169.1 ACT domain-containing protein [Clostridia bacterium]
MRAVLTVIGKDTVGILAAVSAKCAQFNVNINEVTQSVLQDLFCMIMMCDIEKMNTTLSEFSDALTTLGKEMSLSITVMHEDIFNSMHTI